MFANPAVPNVPDFATFVLQQGVPAADLPSGTLNTVTIDTLGNLAAASSAGTIAVGSVLLAGSIPSSTYLATWNGGANTGTITPAPKTPISAPVVMTDSPYVQWAFNIAIGVALISPASMPPILYVMAVYNLGMHQLLKTAQDVGGYQFFADQRKAFKLLTFVAGPVIASADQATSNTLLAPDFLKGLTLADLDLLKTPWGQAYLSYAQSYGPNIVGVS